MTACSMVPALLLLPGWSDNTSVNTLTDVRNLISSCAVLSPWGLCMAIRSTVYLSGPVSKWTGTSMGGHSRVQTSHLVLDDRLRYVKWPKQLSVDVQVKVKFGWKHAKRTCKCIVIKVLQLFLPPLRRFWVVPVCKQDMSKHIYRFQWNLAGRLDMIQWRSC